MYTSLTLQNLDCVLWHGREIDSCTSSIEITTCKYLRHRNKFKQKYAQISDYILGAIKLLC